MGRRYRCKRKQNPDHPYIVWEEEDGLHEGIVMAEEGSLKKKTKKYIVWDRTKGNVEVPHDSVIPQFNDILVHLARLVLERKTKQARYNALDNALRTFYQELYQFKDDIWKAFFNYGSR